MSTVIEIFESLESASGRLEKEAILKSNVKNDLLKRCFFAAQDPYTVFYVNKMRVPKPAALWALQDDETLDRFLTNILPQLATRTVTGNAAKKLVEDALGEMSFQQQKWCQRILLKNLRCGVQVSTTNKIWHKLIPVFSCSLCESVKTEPLADGQFKIVESILYPVFVEPKLDGLRLITIKENGVVTLFTRNGTELSTLPTIAEAIAKAPCDNIVFDGEAMGADWNESNSIVMSKKTKKDDKNMFYNVFDVMTLNEWKAQSCKKTRQIRCFEIDHVIKSIMSPKVRMVSYVVANDEKELRKFYETCVEKGYEGVVIKDPNAPYIFKRSKALLKLKPVTTYEGVIVGWYEGRDGTKREGEFGGFEVVLPNGVMTKCGGGFSDVLRNEFMVTGPKKYSGKVVEMEGQPPLTGDGKVRFPVFTRFRSWNDVDPALEDGLAMYLLSHPGHDAVQCQD